MDPPLDWLEWFSVALPVSGISILLIWIFLLLSYRPGRSVDGDPLEIKPIRASKEKFTLKQYWVTFVCVVTIALWCLEKSIEDWVGDMGIIAVIPIVAFFSTGVLKKVSETFRVCFFSFFARLTVPFRSGRFRAVLMVDRVHCHGRLRIG